MRQALNAQHDWYIGGVSRATINLPPATAGYPRLDLHPQRGIGGWFSTPDADEPDNDVPAGRIGERIYPRATRGKTLTYNLRFKGSQSGGYNNMGDNLVAYTGIFSDVSSLGLMVVTPWPGHGTEIWGTFARALDFDADDVQLFGPTRVPSPWLREPILTIRQLDGLWLHLNESGTFLQAMEWNNLSGNSTTVDNTGTAPTPPSITVFDVAAGDDLHVGRDATGAYPEEDLWFRDPVGAAGMTGTHDVTIDFSQRKAFAETTDVTSCYDAGASTWWDEFKPGVPPGSFNVWKGPGAGTGIHVHFFSCSW
jgi:hypothetical protein